MSATRNGGVRCDTCGRLSRHPLGEYTRPGGSAGYISAHGRADEVDCCEECEEGHCPFCGSERVVRRTPYSGQGVYGWGGRCRACGADWSAPPPCEEG